MDVLESHHVRTLTENRIDTFSALPTHMPVEQLEEKILILKPHAISNWDAIVKVSARALLAQQMQLQVSVLDLCTLLATQGYSAELTRLIHLKTLEHLSDLSELPPKLPNNSEYLQLGKNQARKPNELAASTLKFATILCERQGEIASSTLDVIKENCKKQIGQVEMLHNNAIRRIYFPLPELDHTELNYESKLHFSLEEHLADVEANWDNPVEKLQHFVDWSENQLMMWEKASRHRKLIGRFLQFAALRSCSHARILYKINRFPIFNLANFSFLVVLAMNALVLALSSFPSVYELKLARSDVDEETITVSESSIFCTASAPFCFWSPILTSTCRRLTLPNGPFQFASCRVALIKLRRPFFYDERFRVDMEDEVGCCSNSLLTPQGVPLKEEDKSKSFLLVGARHRKRAIIERIQRKSKKKAWVINFASALR